MSEPKDLGVSPRAVSMARAVDRLPPGEYMLIIRKPNDKHTAWNVNILRPELVQRLDCNRERHDET